MGKVFYSENMVNDFISAAKEMGIGPAIRHLGYPTWGTAQRWFEERGELLPNIDSLAKRAMELRQFYGDKEKLFGAQSILDRIIEKIMHDDLDADEIKKLTDAFHKVVVAFNLIEGKATTVTETRQKDGADLAIMDMVNEAKARNAIKEAELG